jgi:2-oxoglutarate ferredoxin oxidoreductase subunit alpha
MSDEVVGHMVERVVIPPADQIELWERKRPKKPPNGRFDPFLAEDADLVPPMVHAGEGYRIHYTGLTPMSVATPYVG